MRRYRRVARDLNKPYAVVINAASVKREDKEAPAVVPRPVRAEREAFLGSLAAGASAGESNSDAACKLESARPWSAIERSIDAINRARADAAGKAA